MCRRGPRKAAVAEIRKHHGVGYHCRHVQLQARRRCTHIRTAAITTVATAADNAVAAAVVAAVAATAAANTATVVIAAQEASQEQVGLKGPPLTPHHECSWQAQAEDFTPPCRGSAQRPPVELR